MAKVWPVYEGRDPTQGNPWADLPARDATALLQVQESDFLSDLTTTPRFGASHRDLWHLGYRHIVLEVDEAEAVSLGWKPGFYHSPIEPRLAFRKLIGHVVAGAMGPENVLDVQCETRPDSEGRNMLEVTVVVTPGAEERISGRATIDTLAGLRRKLGLMSDDLRKLDIVSLESDTPFLQYATEAELAANAGDRS